MNKKIRFLKTKKNGKFKFLKMITVKPKIIYIKK